MQKNAKQAGRKAVVRRKAGASAPWHLYVVECEDGSLYTGIAIDAYLRYAAHMTGAGARYTRSHPPERLLLCLGYADRSAAAQAEYALKQLAASQKRAFVRSHGGPA